MQTMRYARIRTNMALVWLESVREPRKSVTTYSFRVVSARHGRMSQ